MLCNISNQLRVKSYTTMAFTQTVASAALKMNYLSIIVQICIFNGRVFVLEFRFWFWSYLDGNINQDIKCCKCLNQGFE